VRGFSRALIAVLAWGALSAGARYPWAYWPLALAAANMGVWAYLVTGSRRNPSLRGLTWALLAVTVAMAVQVIPLPYDTFAVLQPAADRFFRVHRVSYAFALPEWHSLSLDTGFTLTALGLFVALAALLVGLARALPHMRLDWLVSRVTALGVLVAIIGVVQRAAMGTRPLVYGVWPASAVETPFGPFFNRNHFAGWMVMALPLALGYAASSFELARRPRRGRVVDWLRWATTPDASRSMVVLFCVLAMAASLVITGSRSGIISFGVAMIVFGWAMARRIGSRAARRLAQAGLIALFAGAVVWAGTHSTIARFSLVSVDLPGRFAAWRDTLHIIRDFPWFGCGLGTYGLAMLVYQSTLRTAIFVQAHNDYLQFVAEGGLLVLIPAVMTVVILVRRVISRVIEVDADVLTYWMRAGAVAGLCGIAAQSLVEYSLQRPGITALAVVLLALAIHRPAHRSGAYENRV
jgi:O-antigen ligase/polysaccharide polymerase Wzy-like membrane protein